MKTRFTYCPVVFCSLILAILIAACTNTPPEGSFSFPLENSCYLPGDEMMIRASATDKDGNIASIEIQLNGNSIATMNTLPYEYIYTVSNIQAGEYFLTGVAKDDKGETGSWETSIVVLPEPLKFTDPRDGIVYRYVRIGSQDWMIDNLAWLPSVSPSTEVSDSIAIYYVSEYAGTDVETATSTENYSVYGALYNWTAAQSCCPEGWHLPSRDEWAALEAYMNMQKGPFNITTYYWGSVWWGMAPFLFHTSGWDIEGIGLNTYGFSALPGGGVFYPPLPIECPGATASDKTNADWWSTTLNEKKGVSAGLWSGWKENFARRKDYPKGFGLSVRCVKDE